MFAMRLATAADAPAVENLILARCAWMDGQGIPSWRESVADLVRQTENADDDMWVLEEDSGRIIGCTTVQEQTPPWEWTERELSEPADYLYTTVTDPAYRRRKPGTVIALWAVDRAAREGKEWVRRGCHFRGLVNYYGTQGFTLVHVVRRTNSRVYLMARRAEPIVDLDQKFKALGQL
ncbi:hypothetical protein GCM10010319_43210 [Streptomyces blastmyceticus]|uniref:N-acetyltransferase domain-containing protein n=2 Tax=Streptomyces blastmyceticus TaxID=68180 RepID=A0ABN0XCX0_9ACTN